MKETAMIYFDHAATSYPKPDEVTEAVRHTILHCGGNPGRSGHPLALAAAARVYETREALADLFGCDTPESFVFTQNATHAINLALKTAVRQGDHVLISDLDHNAVFRPVYRLARDGVISYSVFKTAFDPLRSIENCRQGNTRILLCTHVSNVNGHRLPIERIASYCKSHGIYMILDASQSAGHTPLRFDGLDASAICMPAHKGLLGIQGAGVVYLKDAEGLSEWIEGGVGTHSADTEMPDFLPERYEAGTLPVPAIAALGASIRKIRELGGVEAIEEKECALASRAIDMLSELKGIQIYASATPSSLFSFNVEGRNSEEIAAMLAKAGICVRGGFHCAPLAHRSIGTGENGAVRISFGYANTEEELESFYQTMKELTTFRKA